jgi:hypothetical protein
MSIITARYDKNIVIDLYQYYFNDGFHSIMTDKITRLLISYFMIFLYNFLINCVDYKELLNLDRTRANAPKPYDHESIYDYVHISSWISLNPYLLICFIIYCFYLIFLTFNTINIIKKFSAIRYIYRQYLMINDYRIKFITWDDIVSTFIARLQNTKKTNPDVIDLSNIDIYTVNNKICHQSNIMVSMVRNGYISLPKYSKFLEWNYIFCIIDPILTTFQIPRYSTSSRYSTTTTTTTTTTRLTYLNDDLNNTLDDIHYINNKRIYNIYNNPREFGTIYNNNVNNNVNNVNDVNDVNDVNEIDNQILIQHPRNLAREPLLSNSVNLESQILNQETLQSAHRSSIAQFDSVLYNTLTANDMLHGGGESMDANTNITEYINKVCYRINLVFWVNLISIPFTVIILGLYLIIKYGEQIYRNPGMLFQRRINISTKWKLRFYNELPNLYDERLDRITNNMDKIINTYNSSVGNIIVRFLTFLVGSGFVIVLILSFIANEEFAQLEIIPNHNVIWFLGVSGTLLLILNKLAADNGTKLTKTEQIAAFDALREDLITIHPQLGQIDDREYLVSLIHDIYKPQMINMLYELAYLLLSPYYFWKWRTEVSKNASLILGLLENHYILGNVCRHSIFTNRAELVCNPHMLLSLKQFKVNHNWEIPSVLQINSNLTNSVLLQTFIN